MLGLVVSWTGGAVVGDDVNWWFFGLMVMWVVGIWLCGFLVMWIDGIMVVGVLVMWCCGLMILWLMVFGSCFLLTCCLITCCMLLNYMLYAAWLLGAWFLTVYDVYVWWFISWRVSAPNDENSLRGMVFCIMLHDCRLPAAFWFLLYCLSYDENSSMGFMAYKKYMLLTYSIHYIVIVQKQKQKSKCTLCDLCPISQMQWPNPQCHRLHHHCSKGVLGSPTPLSPPLLPPPIHLVKSMSSLACPCLCGGLCNRSYIPPVESVSDSFVVWGTPCSVFVLTTPQKPYTHSAIIHP